MGLKSSVSEALRIKKIIQEQGNDVTIVSVSKANAQGVEAHTTGEGIYDTLVTNMQMYSECIARDAKYIADVAWGFDQLDQEIGNQHRSN